MKKPKKCVYPDCEKCVYADCRYDGLERLDIVEQNKFDKELEVVEPEVLQKRKNQKKYNATDKGKEKQRRYNSSEKGKIRQKKYNDSEKGKESRNYPYGSLFSHVVGRTSHGKTGLEASEGYTMLTTGINPLYGVINEIRGKKNPGNTYRHQK